MHARLDPELGLLRRRGGAWAAAPPTHQPPGQPPTKPMRKIRDMAPPYGSPTPWRKHGRGSKATGLLNPNLRPRPGPGVFRVLPPALMTRTKRVHSVMNGESRFAHLKLMK